MTVSINLGSFISSVATSSFPVRASCCSAGNNGIAVTSRLTRTKTAKSAWPKSKARSNCVHNLLRLTKRWRILTSYERSNTFYRNANDKAAFPFHSLMEFRPVLVLPVDLTLQVKQRCHGVGKRYDRRATVDLNPASAMKRGCEGANRRIWVAA